MMIVYRFLQWARSASAADRAKAAHLLARAYLESRLAPLEREAAETAMIYLLDDPSPNVRLSLAETLADDRGAPRALVLSLARDQRTIASVIVERSPVLLDRDLVDLVGEAGEAMRMTIARRQNLSIGVVAALVEIGSVDLVCRLLDRDDIAIANVSLARIAERFGVDAAIRMRLLDRDALPGAIRHDLILRVGDALATHALLRATMGHERVRRVTDEACTQATLALAGEVPTTEMPALVEHLRISGRLTSAFLLHALCAKRPDFFVTAVARLSGYREQRVQSLLDGGRTQALNALFRSAGLFDEVLDVMVEATTMRRLCRSDLAAFPAKLATQYADRRRKSPVVDDLLLRLERMDRNARRERARLFASEAENAVHAA
ncbi:DUF2336 domain-containing protein [Pararhizobium mangrovi]|nr:DUF2336 domain-containing protein [Pararhizobium mangrovi]